MAEVVLLAGLGFGDEGKGTTIDWLARGARVGDRGGVRSIAPEPGRRASLVVRYNGGAQAAHNVVAGGRHHTFAQLGGGTFAGVPTLLSRYTLVNPVALTAEARHLASIGIGSPVSMLRVERDALVTTPLHVAMNRLREMARSGRHGSCGMGIGETTEHALLYPDEALRVRDLFDASRTRDKLMAFRERRLSLARQLAGDRPSPAQRRELAVMEEPSTVERSLEHYAAFVGQVDVVGPTFLSDVLRRDGLVLFEGAQGVLLDQDFGFQPHTTWTDITFGNARALLEGAGFDGPVIRLGVVRAYATRHGAGPFVTGAPAFDPLSAHDHNGHGEWQGSFRSGAFDLVATRYALDVIGGVDALVVTNVDRLALLGDDVPVCDAYVGDADPELFEGRGRRITAIRVRRPFDLAHQERLTRALFEVAPDHERVRRDGYAATIAERLGVPLAAVSAGPTADDKLALARPRRGSVSAPQMAGSLL